MRRLTVLQTGITAFTLFAGACSVDRGAPAPQRPAPTTSAAAATAQAPGEKAPVVVEGDLVRVNNRLCGVSRTAMDDDTLGKHVSRVTYAGSDPRFVGKTFEFSQCCPMCLDRFPRIWDERADEILRFHGVELGAGPPAKAG